MLAGAGAGVVVVVVVDTFQLVDDNAPADLAAAAVGVAVAAVWVDISVDIAAVESHVPFAAAAGYNAADAAVASCENDALGRVVEAVVWRGRC